MNRAIHLAMPESYRRNHCHCGGFMERWRKGYAIYWKCEKSRWWNFWQHDFRSENS